MRRLWITLLLPLGRAKKNTNVSHVGTMCCVLHDACRTIPAFLICGFVAAIMVATTRKKNKKKAGVVVDKHAKAVALNMVVSRIETVKANKGAGIELPYGTIAKVIDELLPTYPWLSRNMVKYHLKMLNKHEAESTGAYRGKKETGRDSSIDSGHSKSSLSTLTVSSSEDNHQQDNAMTATLAAGDNDEAEEDEDTNMVLVAEDGGLLKISGVPRFGRPKGSTKTRSREAKDCIRLATNEAAKQYKVMMARNQKENGGRRSRLARGALTSVIATAKQMYNVDESHSICETSI